MLVLGMGLLAPCAQAAIIYNLANVSAGNFENISFRLDSASITVQTGNLPAGTTYGSLFGQYDPMLQSSTYWLGEGYTAPVASGYQATTVPLAVGTAVDASLSWTTQASSPVPATNIYYGLRIDQGSGNYVYGWAQISFGQDASGSTKLVAIAYESTPNTPIVAGATPAPVSVPSTSTSNDRTAPIVKLNGPKKRETTHARIKLKGIARDTSGVAMVTYQVKKTVGKAQGTNQWSLNLSLKKPRTVVKIVAIDTLGNRSRPVKVLVIRK